MLDDHASFDSAAGRLSKQSCCDCLNFSTDDVSFIEGLG